MTLHTSPFGLSTSSAFYRSPASVQQREQVIEVILIGGELDAPGTSSAEPTKAWQYPFIRTAESTGCGFHISIEPEPPVATQSAQQAVAELRRRSGLTWEQLGALFGVSRRSVHFWASGKPLNAQNQQHLMRTLDVVRRADRGTARATRSALTEAADGISPLDLLADHHFERAFKALGQGIVRHTLALPELSPEASAARLPLRPADLVGALQDSALVASGEERLDQGRADHA